MARHEVWAELARLKDTTRFYDAVIDEQDRERAHGGSGSATTWLSDFASCNYLGFDVDPEIMAAPAELIANGARTRAGPGCSATPSRTWRSRTSSPICYRPLTRWCCRPSRTST